MQIQPRRTLTRISCPPLLRPDCACRIVPCASVASRAVSLGWRGLMQLLWGQISRAMEIGVQYALYAARRGRPWVIARLLRCICLELWQLLCVYVCNLQKRVCGVCGLHENLWACLQCGYVGCGRYTAQHAKKHFHNEGTPCSACSGSNMTDVECRTSFQSRDRFATVWFLPWVSALFGILLMSAYIGYGITLTTRLFTSVRFALVDALWGKGTLL